MAFLEVTSPPELRGKRLIIDRDEVIMGRSHQCDFQFADSSVSSRHAAIRREGRKYTLRDLGSTNGTTVNGMSVSELRLNPKDIIALGSVELLFDGEDIEPDVLSSSGGHTTVDTVRMTTGRKSETSAGFSFEIKKDSNALWIVLSVMIVLAVVILALRFIAALRPG